ncbi:MAG: prealbumin-like fold domain-containing protein [Eubacteriaceae bacterium]|nr:prealbumin-like fold domain-containing protein [Eubacteriaceae bacterium]
MDISKNESSDKPIQNSPEVGGAYIEKPFIFKVVDDTTKEPLYGAVFILSQGETQLAFSSSDEDGIVYYSPLYPGKYVIKQILAPPGYSQKQPEYELSVDGTGNFSIAGFEPGFIIISNTPI